MSNDPLRIAMISYYLPSCSKIGVGYQVHEIANELVRRGHRVDVFSECPPVEGALYALRQIRLDGSFRTFRFATKIRKVDFSGYDVLHAHGDDYWLWRSRGPFHVRTVHGSCFEEALRIHGLKERLRMVLLGFSELAASVVADATVVVSPATRRWMPWVSRVIPNGVDSGRFYPDESRRSQHPVVLFVGTWHGRKRGAELAASFSRDVRPRLNDAELWMVTRDAPSALPEGVRVLGALSDDDLASMYRKAWVFCLPSAYEGFGIPYAEALTSGLPVVATPNVGARYVTDEGAAGLLVPLEQIGHTLAELLADPARQLQLKNAGLIRAQKFSLASVVDTYEALYRARAIHPPIEPRPTFENRVESDAPFAPSASTLPRLRLGAYVLAADPTWIRSSLGRYYDELDSLVVSLPKDGRGWTGAPVSAAECLELIRSLDTRGIVKVVEGSWTVPDNPALGDTRQRQDAIAALQEMDWILQLDTDELLPDFSVFRRALAVADAGAFDALEWPMRVLYRRLRSAQYLEVVSADGKPRYEYPGPVAVRPNVLLTDCRRTAQPTLRAVVDGDDQSLELYQALRPGEQRQYLLKADQAIVHNSWARDRRSVKRKIASWGHNRGMNTKLYYLRHWLPAPVIWRFDRDLHPFAKGLWPRLAVSDAVFRELMDPSDR